MKAPKAQPAPVDVELFRQALDGVTPLPPGTRVAAAKPLKFPRSNPPANAPLQDTLSDHGAEDKLLIEFARQGISRMTLRKLRRGEWPIQDRLDLHSLHSEAARQLLLEFLHDATHNGLRCVCIIHGKGRHSEGREGILKCRVRHWLTQCAEVLAFCETPPNEGGGGAVKVLLKNL